MAREWRRGLPSVVATDLTGRPELDHDELRERMSGNLCRCGAYNGIVAAIGAGVKNCGSACGSSTIRLTISYPPG